jgi:hypothetical protein
MTELNPFTFDVESWLTDAALPEESATVYKRADVVSELSDLKRRIDIETRSTDPEQSSAAKRPAGLERQYEELLHTFSDSALTVYVRALTDDELTAVREEFEAGPGKDLTGGAHSLQLGYWGIARSIIAVKPAGGTRQPVTMTPDAVKAMKDAIGSAQMAKIVVARKRAQDGLPQVDADFLRKRSGSETGDE